MRLAGILLFFLPALLLGQEVPKKLASPFAEIAQAIEAERAQYNIPSLSIAVVDDQQVIWSQAFGVTDVEKKTPATTDTIYRVGSVSKMFTDLAIMQLVEEGKIDLDKPVQQYLPNFKPKNDYGVEITLRQLMAHQSGLVREPPLGNYFDPEPPSLEKTVESLNGVPLIYKPGTKTKYSNAAIAVVGRVVEVLDGQPFPKAAEKRILKKLAMTQSAFDVNDTVKKFLTPATMWTYHGREFPAPTFELGEGPAGCLYSTPSDLCKLLSCFFNNGKTADGILLKPESVKEMLRAQYEAAPGLGFGFGFMISKLDEHPRIGHGGAVYGFSTELAALPEKKLGVVVVSSKDVTNAITTRLADYTLRAIIAQRENKPIEKYLTTKPIEKTMLDKLPGRYGKAGEYKIFRTGDKLQMLFPNGGYIFDLERRGESLVLGGILGNRKPISCDGQTLMIDKNNFERFAEKDQPPAECPREMLGLIGEYGWDHIVHFIFEWHGQLYSLIEWVFLYPLTKESDDVYAFPKEGGLYHGEKLVFTRDKTGKATKVVAASVEFNRRVLDGDDGKTFKIPAVQNFDEIWNDSLKGKPPVDLDKKQPAKLVPLAARDKTFKFDLRYASVNNFLSRPVYPKNAAAYMEERAADELVKVQQELRAQGLGLLIFDAYRPWHVTKVFWDCTPEKFRHFVADPSKGSRHNRGCAVDLTLYDLKTGQPLEMVSGFDEFSDRAYPNYWGGTHRQRWARDLLRRAMEAQQFTVYEAEWWHFDYTKWKDYPINNLSFDQLEKGK